MADTYKEYGTGAEIWTEVFEELPRDANSTHPGQTQKLRMINEVMRTAHSIGFHHMKREIVTFQDGGTNDTYYQLTTDCKIFKLKTVHTGTGGTSICRTPATITDYNTIKDYRDDEVEFASGTYVFSENLYPAGQNMGVVRVEIFPDPPASPGVDAELFYEYIPYVTALSTVIYYPRAILVHGLDWRMKRIVAPDMSAEARALFEEVCLEDRRVGAVSGRAEFPKPQGWILDFESRFR